jgi:hypothetical protein
MLFHELAATWLSTIATVTLITIQKIAAALDTTVVELVSEPTGGPKTSD